jgi:hypothetical protein
MRKGQGRLNMLELAFIDDLVAWQLDRTRLLDKLATLPTAYTTAARTLLRSLESCGARYEQLVRGRVIEFADWQAEVDAHRAEWEAAIEPLATMAQRGWRTSKYGTPFLNPSNPSGIALPFSIDEMPDEYQRAGLLLLDADGNPSVQILAREPGLWGNLVSVSRQGDLLYARFGNESVWLSVTIDVLVGTWQSQEPRLDPWPENTGIGALIERPTWHPGATQLPADDALWKPLIHGRGLCLGRLLGQALKIVDAGGAFEPIDRALCSQLYRVPVKLCRYGGNPAYFHPVPVGPPETDFGTPGTFSTVWEAHERLADCLKDVYRFIDALAA